MNEQATNAIPETIRTGWTCAKCSTEADAKRAAEKASEAEGEQSCTRCNRSMMKIDFSTYKCGKLKEYCEDCEARMKCAVCGAQAKRAVRADDFIDGQWYREADKQTDRPTDRHDELSDNKHKNNKAILS